MRVLLAFSLLITAALKGHLRASWETFLNLNIHCKCCRDRFVTAAPRNKHTARRRRAARRRAAPKQDGRPPVLLADLPDEEHE